MDLTSPGQWQPANDVEHALEGALARGSVDDYRGVLGSATVWLPVPPDVARTDHSPAPWATGVADGRTFIIGFTSVEAMRFALGHTHARRVPFPDLAQTWPDRQAWLAINPGTPVAARLDAEAIANTAMRSERAAYPVDAALRASVGVGDRAAYALSLLAADLALPVRPDAPPHAEPGDPDFGWWHSSTADGDAVIVAYSTRQRLTADLGDVRHTVVDTAAVLAAWPGPSVSLAINPGMPVAGLISGAAIVGLARWVGEVSESAQDAAARAGSNPAIGEQERELAAYQAARDAVAAMLRA